MDSTPMIDSITENIVNFTSKVSDSQKVLDWLNGPPEDIELVPKFRQHGIWVVGWMVILEYFVLWMKGKELPALHENILSFTHAIIFELSRLFIKGIEFSIYIYLWKNYALFPNWGSNGVWSFIYTAIFIDFCYYWLHRISHEVMIFWAIHQVHHSSEDFTFSVGLRHSPLQTLFTWVFYLPLALLGIPPNHMVGHLQLNLLYQCWLHTTSIDNIGILENVLNTPSLHRVHHGSIKYCIDVNYGGITIIWDRLFGTYQVELPDVKIYYGIVIQPHFYNPLYHQLFYFEGAAEKAQGMTNQRDYISTWLKGPSWLPGASRTGRELDSSALMTDRIRVPANTSVLLHTYTILHLIGSIFLTSHLSTIIGVSTNIISIFIYAVIVLASLSHIGMLYEGRPSIRRLEILRNSIGIFVLSFIPLPQFTFQLPLIILYSLSFILWVLTPPKSKVNVLTYVPEKKVQ